MKDLVFFPMTHQLYHAVTRNHLPQTTTTPSTTSGELYRLKWVLKVVDVNIVSELKSQCAYQWLSFLKYIQESQILPAPGADRHYSCALSVGPAVIVGPHRGPPRSRRRAPPPTSGAWGPFASVGNAVAGSTP